MKNKKLWIIVGIIVLVLLIIIGIILLNKKDNTKIDDNKKTSLVEEAAKNNTKSASEYKKFLGGEVLNENTLFNEYTFISDNKAYIFDPAKLKNEDVSY